MAKTPIEAKHPALVNARNRKQMEQGTISEIIGWESFTRVEKDMIIAYRTSESKAEAARFVGRDHDWFHRRQVANRRFHAALDLVRTGQADEALYRHIAKDSMPDVIKMHQENLKPGTPMNHRMASAQVLQKLAGMDKPSEVAPIQNNYIRASTVAVGSWSPSVQKFNKVPPPSDKVEDETIVEGELVEQPPDN
jgi:hypothetical protein